MDIASSMKREIDDFPDLVGAFLTSPSSNPPSTSTFTPTRLPGDSFSLSPSLIEHSFSNQTPREEFACAACGYEIRERYLLRVMDDFWHEMCLRCFSCDRALSEKDTCFVKDGRVYCKEDHSQLFSAKCARCHGALQPTDFVFRCMQNTYHAGCFSCVYCQQPLKKGDQYFFVDGQTICQHDYNVLLCQQLPPPPLPDAPYGPMPGFYDIDAVDVNRKTPKRPRTILNSQQRKAFKYAFEKSAKPSRKVREQLAKETGLSVRVVQVWFQNQRAKIKKQQRKQEDSKPNGVNSTDSEGKSLDDSKSTCDSLKSDDEIDSDGEEFDIENVEDEKQSGEVKDFTPIEKLCNMHTVYFNCA